MSKFVKRIGKKTIKFQINVHIDKVNVNIKFPCQLFIIWKRGPRTQETRRADMDLTSGSATFNEDLQLSATLFQDIKTKKYLEKKSTFTVVIVTPKGNKVAGTCDIDIANYPNQGLTERKEVLGLKKSPDPNAKLHFTIQVILLSEVDNMSMMSDIVEQDEEEEAGSMEVSQFDYDTTRIEGSRKNSTRTNMDNVLSSLSTKNQIEEEVKQNQLRRQEEESPKLAGLNQPSTQAINPRKMTREKTEPETTGAASESKKAGFKQLFEKGLKESVSEARSNTKAGQGSEAGRGLSQEPRPAKTDDNYTNGQHKYEKENLPKASVSDSGLLREMDELKDELTRKQTECGKLRKALENLKQENEELRAEGKTYESSSDEVLELRQRINDKNNEISDLNGRVDELQKTIDDLKQNIYRLNKEKAQEIRNVSQEIDKLKDQKKISEQERMKLEQENQNQASRISKLETDLKNLKSDYNMLKKESDNNLELYHSTINKVDEMASSSQTADLEIKGFKDKIASLEQEKQRMREQLRIVQSERDDFQKKGSDLTNIAKEKIRVAEEENTKLKERLQEIEKGYKEQLTKAETSVLDLKKKLKESEGKKEDALSKQTELAIELQNLKINFERINSELEYIKKSQTSESENMESLKEGTEKEITKLRDKLAATESKFKTNEIEYQRKIEELKTSSEKYQTSYEEVNAEKERLEGILKEKEHNTSMRAAKEGSEYENIKKSLESQIQVLTEDVNLRTTAFNNIKKENRDLIEQVQTLKQQNFDLEAKINEQNNRMSSQMNELHEKIRLTETNSRPMNRELKEENDRLKKELSMIQKNTKAAQDVEKEVGHLSIENETLKKQVRELTAKVSNSKISADNQNAKDNEELKKKVKDLTRSLKKTEEDYNETKTKLTTTQKKNEEDDELLLKLNNKVTHLQESVSIMENEVVKTKQKIGEIMNVIMENADVDLVDRVNNVVYENN